jgi:hypothetical protein
MRSGERPVLLGAGVAFRSPIEAHIRDGAANLSDNRRVGDDPACFLNEVGA